jgi:hypothetical protein
VDRRREWRDKIGAKERGGGIKKKRKSQRGGYRVGERVGKEKERGRVGRWINRREKGHARKQKREECGVLYR